jgi:hypothetical protein
MRLILTKTTDERTWKCGFHDLFSNWLWYNNIFIGEYRRDWELSYNDFYHFYDLSLFEIKGNYGDSKRYHFKQVEDFFKQEGYSVENCGHTYRWEDVEDGKERKQRPGIRLWICPKGYCDVDILSIANKMLGDMRTDK